MVSIVGVDMPVWPRVQDVRLRLIDDVRDGRDVRIGLTATVRSPAGSVELSVQARVDDALRVGQAYIGRGMVLGSYGSLERDVEEYLGLERDSAVAVREVVHHVIDLAGIMALSQGEVGVRMVQDEVNLRLHGVRGSA